MSVRQITIPRSQNYKYKPEFQPLSQENVLDLAKKYHNIKKIEYLCNDTIKIVTKLDTFFCEVWENCLVLKHQVNPIKQHTHLQRIYYDFPFMFESLERHDIHKFTQRGTCKVNNLFALLSH
jgi:hypothetical protein